MRALANMLLTLTVSFALARAAEPSAFQPLLHSQALSGALIQSEIHRYPVNLQPVGTTGIAFPFSVALGSGALAGKLFANKSDGNLYETDLNNSVTTLIASGGEGGQQLGADPNGSLLVTSGGTVYRLTGPAGSGFGATSATPEPASFLLIASAIVGLALATRHRRFNSSSSSSDRGQSAPSNLESPRSANTLPSV